MLLDELYSELEQDCESTTHQLYFLETPQKDGHSEQTDDNSSTFADKNNMILVVTESEEVESRNLRSPTSSNSYEVQQDQVESCDDQYNEASSKIQMKSSLGEGVQEKNDGFQTPTKFLDNKLPSNSLKCPPAPRKPKAKPLRKRKRVCRNLQIEFVTEVESALRLLINGDHPNVKRARSRGG